MNRNMASVCSSPRTPPKRRGSIDSFVSTASSDNVLPNRGNQHEGVKSYNKLTHASVCVGNQPACDVLPTPRCHSQVTFAPEAATHLGRTCKVANTYGLVGGICYRIPGMHTSSKSDPKGVKYRWRYAVHPVGAVQGELVRYTHPDILNTTAVPSPYSGMSPMQFTPWQPLTQADGAAQWIIG